MYMALRSCPTGRYSKGWKKAFSYIRFAIHCRRDGFDFSPLYDIDISRTSADTSIHLRRQNVFFALHIIAYFAYIVPIWVNAPTATHYQVWGEFQNTGGWSSMGLAVLVGQLTGISEQCGIDTVSQLRT